MRSEKEKSWGQEEAFKRKCQLTCILHALHPALSLTVRVYNVHVLQLDINDETPRINNLDPVYMESVGVANHSYIALLSVDYDNDTMDKQLYSAYVTHTDG